MIAARAKAKNPRNGIPPIAIATITTIIRIRITKSIGFDFLATICSHNASFISYKSFLIYYIL